MKKTVAIIGAGPSGLVAAKTLLRSSRGPYDVRIFEKTSDIGGLWAVSKERPYDGMLNPDMPTNLSRYNIGFSDFAWSSAGFEGHVNYWPRAWQVNQYLKAYVKKFIPCEVFQFNTRVTYANFEGASSNGEKASRWKLRWKRTLAQQHDEIEELHEELFDHLIIATGLFGSSSMPEYPGAEAAGIKIVHSTKLRKLSDVAPDHENTTGTILVVGGGMSGGDASTVLAMQLSNAAHSATDKGCDYGSLKLVQLCSDAAYALPLAAPSDKSQQYAPEFLPLDLCMYRLETRPPGPIEVRIGKSPPETIKTIHDAFQGIVGNQSDLQAPGLKYDQTSRSPYVTLTEQYAGFIRSGNIDILTGRLKELRPSSKEDRVRAVVQNESELKTIDDVVGIVFATGFTPQPSLDFLAPELKECLLHDSFHNRLPIILDDFGTISNNIPGLAVIGFHEGAFWGSMEMEAHLVEQQWSTEETVTNGHSAENYTSQKNELLDLRTAMNNKETNIPQYWLGDYVGLMETIARRVGIQRADFDWPKRTGPVAISRYAGPNSDQDEVNKSQQEYLSILQRSKTEGLFAPRAAYLGLHGHWTIKRTIISSLDTMPSGELTGTASFHPRLPSSPDYDFEYLYTENGTFKMNNGLTMQASRQYVYRYEEAKDQITVWFVKTTDGKTVDYMYHGLTFDARPQARKDGWLAKADHLCVADMYRSDYRFRFQGANLGSFVVSHAVKGPKKDYVSATTYQRPIR